MREQFLACRLLNHSIYEVIVQNPSSRHTRFDIRQHFYMLTYIIGHYNTSIRNIDLVSHTNYVVCVNFTHEWRDLQFKIDSERQIVLRNMPWKQFYLLLEFLPEICWDEIAEEILFLYFVLICAPGLEPLGLLSQHTTSTRLRRLLSQCY